jgi:hypothetical protein
MPQISFPPIRIPPPPPIHFPPIPPIHIPPPAQIFNEVKAAIPPQAIQVIRMIPIVQGIEAGVKIGEI